MFDIWCLNFVIFLVTSSNKITCKLVTAGSTMRDGNLFVRQIAGRIGRPDIAADRLSPHPEITATDIQPGAGGAAPLDMLFLFLEFAQQRFGSVIPNF